MQLPILEDLHLLLGHRCVDHAKAAPPTVFANSGGHEMHPPRFPAVGMQYGR
jgi:hypothetical protein